jgi:hypothetical protein
MSQVDAYTIPGSPLNMAQLQARLHDLFAAAASCNRGATSPTSPFQGMLWWDTSASPTEVLRRYTVAMGWRSLASVNINTGAVQALGAWGGDTIPIAKGGTGATTQAGAQSSLGVPPSTRNMVAGNGLDGGGTLASDRTFTLGTPSSLSGGTSNGVTANSHTHALLIASEAQALAGTDNSVLMTPLRSKQAIDTVFQEAVITLGGDFTGTGATQVRVTRVGRQVTVSSFAATSIGHNSSSNPQSTAGVIPSWARPESLVQNTYYSNPAAICTASVTGAGNFGIFYIDHSGNLVARVTTLTNFTISYNV